MMLSVSVVRVWAFARVTLVFLCRDSDVFVFGTADIVLLLWWQWCFCNVSVVLLFS